MEKRCPYCGRQSQTAALKGKAWSCLPCVLQGVFPYFTRLHWRIWVRFYLVFAGWVLLLLLPGAITGHGEPFSTSVWGVILSFSGPFTGMISREFHSAYLFRNIVPYCGAALGLAFLFQVVPLPRGSIWFWSRITVWCFGLLVWFSGSILSTLYANS